MVNGEATPINREEGMLATPQHPTTPHPLNLKSEPEAVEESGDEDSCSSSAASSCADSTGNEQNKFNGINLSNMPGLISPTLVSQNQNMVNAPLNLSLNSNNVSANGFNTRTDSKNPLSGSTPPTNMPHFILASGQLVQGIQGAQLIIPTTQGITTQTILTIPVNNVTCNQPVNLALNNGQVISTTIANLQSMAQANPLFNNNGAVSPDNQQQQQQQTSSLSSSAQQLLASALTSINLASMNKHQRSSSTSVPSHPSLSSHHHRSPSYLNTNHHYQNNPRKSPHEPNNNNCTPTSTPLPHSIPNKPNCSPPHVKSSLQVLNNNNLSNNNNLRRSLSPGAPPANLPPSNSPLSRLSGHNGELTITPSTGNSNHKYADYASSERPDSPDDLSDEPNETMISQSNSNMVDGINLDEIKEFAKAFKLRRLSLGLTQTQVGQALSVTEGPAYSQSAICSALATQMLCAAQIASQQQQQQQQVQQQQQQQQQHQQQNNMFEKLDITPKSAQKIKPVLERWMKEAEERYKSGQNHLTEFIGMEPSKKRKRRTSFTPQALELLNAHFERNTHPSGTEITTLAHQLGYEREVIRIWFCNKRQALKNTVRMMSKGSL